ncbi:MAG: hypothetical protein EBU90_07670 [Proteobacteria bacterium]|nr:hypothetical protein [Pseudomonadota bacterium]NBP13420.1 hypothetical protein [bacterium]
MAITKTVIKKVRQQAIIRFIGDGTSNVDSNVDIALSDETFEGYANVNVNINSIIFTNGSTANPITITRNGSTVLQLFGNDNWSFAQMNGFVLTDNNNSNISVTIPSPGGTVLLGVTKAKGYREPDQQRFSNGR